MKFVIDNIKTKVIAGGKDNLVGNLLEQLNDYLKVRPDNYGHSKAYRDHHWDGWKRFITKKGEFATGFLPMVAAYVEELGYDIEIEDNRTNLPIMMPINPYIGMIDGSEWVAFDYQVDMVQRVDSYLSVKGTELYFPRGILDCATNAGKNTMAALLFNSLVGNPKGIFLVSNTVIYNQAVKFFSQALGEKVGEVSSKKFNIERFTVCMVKTLLNRAKDSLNVRKWMHDTQVLIVDESDEAGASEYSKVLMYINAGMRVFLSGTPLDASKVNNMIAVGLSGKVLGKITNKFLIDNGYSQNPNVTMLLNNSGKEYFLSYEQELEKYIHTSEKRANMVCDIIQKHEDKSILISFIERKHGYFMYDYIRSKLPGVEIDIVHGMSDNREDVIDNFKKGRIQVLLSSMILKKGANIPNINVLIMAQGGKSKITVKQVTGRGLRKNGDETDMWLYDFWDTGKYLSAHSAKRVKIYQGEEFDVTFDYPNKKGKPIL